MLIPVGDVPRWYAERKPPGTVAVTHGDEELTWEAMECGANRRARAFAELGVKPGDFVAIGLPNGNLVFETSFAIWKLGATPAPLSPRLPRGEAAAILDVLRPSLLVGGEPDWKAPKAVPVDFSPEGFSDDPVDGPVCRYISALPTGGSTGRPKVIVRHLPAVVDTNTPEFMMERGRVSLLNPGPLSNGAPFMLSHFALFAGGRVTSMMRFDAEETLRLIETNKVSWVNFVPTMMHRIWSLPEETRRGYDLSSLKTVMHMSAPIPVWLKEKWIEWLGPERLYELYVGSEMIGYTLVTGVEWLDRRGSVGRIDPALTRILDDNGNDVPTGETGEIYFRPVDGAVTYHYLGGEPRARPGGWQSLGDLGRLDAAGYLYLADRRSDMILRGGVNIFPAEIEAALLAHPGIASCAVIGLPDDDLGNRLHAIIELQPGAGAEEVVDGMGAFLKERLVRYKHPESYELATSGVRDDAGKVRRTGLRAERIAWLAEGRDFRLTPRRTPARAG